MTIGKTHPRLEIKMDRFITWSRQTDFTIRFQVVDLFGNKVWLIDIISRNRIFGVENRKVRVFFMTLHFLIFMHIICSICNKKFNRIIQRLAEYIIRPPTFYIKMLFAEMKFTNRILLQTKLSKVRWWSQIWWLPVMERLIFFLQAVIGLAWFVHSIRLKIRLWHIHY